MNRDDVIIEALRRADGCPPPFQTTEHMRTALPRHLLVSAAPPHPTPACPLQTSRSGCACRCRHRVRRCCWRVGSRRGWRGTWSGRHSTGGSMLSSPLQAGSGWAGRPARPVLHERSGPLRRHQRQHLAAGAPPPSPPSSPPLHPLPGLSRLRACLGCEHGLALLVLRGAGRPGLTQPRRWPPGLLRERYLLGPGLGRAGWYRTPPLAC